MYKTYLVCSGIGIASSVACTSSWNIEIRGWELGPPPLPVFLTFFPAFQSMSREYRLQNSFRAWFWHWQRGWLTLFLIFTLSQKTEATNGTCHGKNCRPKEVLLQHLRFLTGIKDVERKRSCPRENPQRSDTWYVVCDPCPCCNGPALSFPQCCFHQKSNLSAKIQLDLRCSNWTSVNKKQKKRDVFD